jgi:hypothetical protein
MRKTLVLAAVLIGLPSIARAQSAGPGAAELFEQGRAALVAKDYLTACAKLEASLALERAVGTLISLAQCEQASGKLASARQHWKEAADFATATHDRLNRAPYAQKQLAEIEPRVPRVVVRLAPGAPHATRVTIDGVEIKASALDTPLPVNPGALAISASAAGRPTSTVSITLAERETRTVDVAPGPVEDAPPNAPEPEVRSHSSVLPWIAVGVAAVGVGAGAVTGSMAASKWSDAKDSCGVGCPVGSAPYDDRDDAKTLATVSTIAFAVGIAGAATAVVLFLTSPKRAAAVVSPVFTF